MRNFYTILTLFSFCNICTAQPALSLWIMPDGYHQDHEHAAQEQYFCDSSYYLFYHNNLDTIFVSVKNEGTETLDLASVSTQSIEGASFQVVNFTSQQILPGEMYSLQLVYQLPSVYANGINGQLNLSSNDPEKANCALYFDVGCNAEWDTRTSDIMGVEGSCSSPVIWIEDIDNSLSNPNMLYDDSMNFYTYEAGFQSLKVMQLDHKAGVIIPNYLSVHERLEAGSRSGDFSNFKADSNLVQIRKELDVDGKVTIGDSLSVSKAVYIGQSLNVSQNVRVGGTLEVEALTSPSDRRLKQEIVPLSDALHKIMALHPKSYYMKDVHRTNQRQFGFIAQELEATVPELVYTKADDMKSVNYIQLIPWLTAALQEQQQTITRLEKRIAELEEK